MAMTWSLKLGTHSSQGVRIDKIPRDGERAFLSLDLDDVQWLLLERPPIDKAKRVEEVVVDLVSTDHCRIHASYV